MKFSQHYFPNYSKLKKVEQLFLRTCCYFPPKPRRARKEDDVLSIDHFISVYENAFSSNVWPLCMGRDVLDFGCGEGGYVLALAEKGASLAAGVDIQNQFEFARGEAKRRGLEQVRFVHGSSDLIQSESFAVAISHNSFEHFENPKYILEEMIRITKPGGSILIKFGPPWKNPWGRHMSGTIRKDRPWVHLFVSEKVIMRVHSVYHNEPILKERYTQKEGGLNKMTIMRFKQILKNQKGIDIIRFEVNTMFDRKIFKTPIIREFFASSVMAELKKVE